ncbi:VanZ family protein [Mariprofundus ferrinatatus]|uniref:VanZ family protein n=1 Tax=Mariprofundus ferrinatatus TaxID=1921087 RepID=UPI000C22CD9B
MRCNAVAVVRWILFLFTLVWVTVSMTLSSTSLERLRSEFSWIGQPLNWIDSFWPSSDIMHALLFALLSFVARVALPTLSLRTLVVCLALFAGASELVQFWVPGREPWMSDFALDMVGVLAGLLSCTLCVIGWGRISARLCVK